MNQDPRSLRFRKAREATWTRLESLLHKVSSRGLKKLEPEEVVELPTLYRATLSSLNHARAISLDSNLLNYLESLSTRAYVVLYSPRQSAIGVCSEFINTTFPSSVRALRGYVMLSGFALFLGVLIGWYLVSGDSVYFHSFVPESYAQSRSPSTSAEDLRAILYDSAPPDGLAAFAAQLLSNNAKIGMNCFALGIAAGVPVLILLLYNGLIIGAFVSLYQSKGLTLEFIAWILPHGVTEIFAVILCGAAGLLLGRAIVWPGQLKRSQSIRQSMAIAGPVVLGAVAMFFVAALIEGFFRQMVHQPEARWLFAASSILFWVAYLSRKTK